MKGDDVAEEPGFGVVEFPRHPAVSAAARRAAEKWCVEGDVLDAAARDVVLVVSELVTNALLHGQGRITLELRLDSDDVLVRVSDHGREGPPIVATTPQIFATSGRGWLMTQAIATSTGIINTLHGKTVWARLPRQRR